MTPTRLKKKFYKNNPSLKVVYTSLHTGYLAVATQLKSESRIKLAGVTVQQTQIFNDNLTLSGWLSDQSRKISSKQLHC